MELTKDDLIQASKKSLYLINQFNDLINDKYFLYKVTTKITWILQNQMKNDLIIRTPKEDLKRQIMYNGLFWQEVRIELTKHSFNI